jgi:hypothetical protein
MGGSDLVLKNWAASIDLNPLMVDSEVTPVALLSSARTSMT